MSLAELLRESRGELIGGAAAAVHQARLEHYEEEGLQALRERLAVIHDLTLDCLEQGHADAIIDWATRVANERFAAGYDLIELQTAINVLEEAFWRRLLSSRRPESLAHDLGLVNSILGMAKDALARTYVTLAMKRGGSSVSGSRRY